MLKKFLLLSVVVVCICAGIAQAIVIEHFLDVPPSYTRTIGPIVLTEHSETNIFVENILDDTRWKDWEFKIWVKDTGPVLTTMNVNYDLTANHSNPVALFPVNLVPLTEAPPFPGFKGFYASTFESGWEQYGTVLPGEPGLYPIGNPWWVSFHINVPDTYHDWLVYSIYDECVPEPATMCLLGLGGLALIRKRRA